MKRFFTYILVFLAASAFPVTAVRASTDTAFTTAQLNWVGSVIARIGNVFNIDVAGLIQPDFTKPGEIAHPDNLPMAGHANTFNALLMPQNYKDDGKHLDAREDQIRTSLYGITFLKSDAGAYGDNPPPTDCMISQGLEKSAPVPWAKELFQAGETADAFLGLYEKNPNENGVVDFNWKVDVLHGMNAAEDCKKQDPGFESIKQGNDLKALSSFGSGTQTQGNVIQNLMGIITSIINGAETQVQKFLPVPVQNKVILTNKMRQPNQNCLTHFGGGPEAEAGECSGNSAKSGGFSAFNLTEEQKAQVTPGALHPYQVVIANNGNQKVPVATMNFTSDLQYQAEYSMQRLDCTVVPDTSNTPLGNIQNRVAIGGFVSAEEILGKAAGNGTSGNVIPINRNGACEPPEKTPSSGWNCRTGLPELASAELNAAGQNYADNAIYTNACKTNNAWKQCHNDVIDRSRKACVDPTFALAMWLHESGASNYECGRELTGGEKVQDFGINIDSIAENFSAQIDRFLTLDYNCPHTIKDFFSVYALGRSGGVNVYKCYGELTIEDQAQVDAYTAEIQTIYSQLGGGTLPSWPKGSCSQ